MILDFSQIAPPVGVITFPDVPSPAQPKQPSELVESATLAGSAVSTVSIGGSVDSPQ